ncbi:hypothetical protein [Aquimarina aggregata]|uniref:hypothetical protein n=1 Tax=Aquimarina aggregata TaxID=1642818 RepID=UPI00249302A8|nr:hypothetical protein [Aquimarina aggregata]
MLSKKQCIKAIQKWKIIRSDYKEIKELIPPIAIFEFSKSDCKWLEDHNKNSKFHVYIGVHINQFILIIVPLEQNGKEQILANYLTSDITLSKDKVTFVETDIIIKTTKTNLNHNLEITHYLEESNASVYNEPTITEKTSVYDIEKWRNESLDWFYNECNYYNGDRIVRAFTVPFPDLSWKDKQYKEVKVFFGFKNSSIYQRLIPILIFVAINNKTGTGEIIRSLTSGNRVVTNIRDWSQPCPPMCRGLNDYIFLD